MCCEVLRGQIHTVAIPNQKTKAIQINHNNGKYMSLTRCEATQVYRGSWWWTTLLCGFFHRCFSFLFLNCQGCWAKVVRIQHRLYRKHSSQSPAPRPRRSQLITHWKERTDLKSALRGLEGTLCHMARFETWSHGSLLSTFPGLNCGKAQMCLPTVVLHQRAKRDQYCQQPSCYRNKSAIIQMCECVHAYRLKFIQINGLKVLIWKWKKRNALRWSGIFWLQQIYRKFIFW